MKVLKYAFLAYPQCSLESLMQFVSLAIAQPFVPVACLVDAEEVFPHFALYRGVEVGEIDTCPSVKHIFPLQK